MGGRWRLKICKSSSFAYLERNEGLDGTALDLDAGGDNLDDTTIKDLVTLWHACDSHELHFKDDVSARILNHSVLDFETLFVLVTGKEENIQFVGFLWF